MQYGKKMGLVVLFSEEHLNAEKHLEQLRLDEADLNCDPVYCNAAFLGVYPCFVPLLVPEGVPYQYKFSDEVQDLVDNMDFEARRALTGHMLKRDPYDGEELAEMQRYFPALPRERVEIGKDFYKEHTSALSEADIAKHKDKLKRLGEIEAELQNLGYSLADLDNSNPYNQWMHEN